MKKLYLEKIYLKTTVDDPVRDLMLNILRDAPEELVIAMKWGCVIDTVVENGILKVGTRFPISILKDAKGNVIDVYEKKRI